MKITIELPDWCDERHIYVMAGIELAAYKDAGSTQWYIKTVRCNQCGLCCKGLVNDGQYTLNEKGDCIHLIADGDKLICELGATRPFPCCEGDLVKNGENKNNICCIEYRAI